MQSNRDFYQFIAELVGREGLRELKLRDFLARLRTTVAGHRAGAGLELETWAQLLEAAAKGEVEAPARPEAAHEGWREWDELVARQIQDLEAMRRAGTFDNEYRYYGVDAPGGSRWYNFDPVSFLECAAAGSIGGWVEGDDTGRSYVPGKTVALDEEGNMKAVDPRELDRPPREVAALDWEALCDFMWCGQAYE